ncbi:DUF2922 domain-containing protein [Bacillus sp. REN10]|uniref:DUF2922 domain-containing protein n=1 Tax=Bacillus sp. REN10 TaxID=2782541 RepID=UPI00193BD5E4|nr:DUF2922 domain-containing protein [Bacillus sp. REN10]
MAKTLQLQFTTDLGKTASLTIDDPKEPIDPALVKQSMEAIIAANVFNSTSGKFAAAKDANLVDRTVTNLAIN